MILLSHRVRISKAATPLDADTRLDYGGSTPSEENNNVLGFAEHTQVFVIKVAVPQKTAISEAICGFPDCQKA